ncbi:serine/threonine-protein phosphatase PPQ-like [Bradysia coprophila]|uniref:serine/threonine-protein phosphatase PPQ-like n=1 Tax=Bradysia coprophila TaxID=38358 RepID=UPI00187D6F11|nr:serine/threonine-protein phosphatase PPQ-like [Bradysia coprophila]
MSTTRTNSFICDIISVLFHKKSTNTGTNVQYLLQQCNDLLTLPCSKIREENWNATANHVQDTVIGSRFDKTILKIVKVWVPNFPRKHVYHVIFSVQIPTGVDTIKSSNNHFKWMSFADIEGAAKHAMLYSPEILTFAILSEAAHGEIQHLSEYLLDLDENKDLLTEVLDKNVLLLQTESTPEKYLELLKSAEIGMSEQRCLYTDFIQNSFPYLYMNGPNFVHIITENVKWDKADALSLFRSADLHGRGALSFQDFLLISAACSRTTPHTGLPAEARSRYIFRFFDDDSDGLMSYSNFTNLIKCIRIAKNLPTDNGSISEEVKKYEASIGISPSISMTQMQFCAAVGELKLRGTSTLLRFPNSIKEYMFHHRTNQMKPSTYQVGSISANPDATETIDDKRIVPTVYDDKFNISTHSLKIKNSGAFIDIDEIWSQHDWVSPSSSRLMKTAKNKISIERFNQASAPNEIINFLKYFSQPSAVDGKSKMCWGTFDMKKLGMAIIVLSSSLTSIMENEQRMLEIASPVYVMGDLHGNFDNLMHFEEIFWPLSPTLSPCNLLFLGDYVDRGLNGLEVVCYLFAYKLHNPKKVFLLRGNHEVRDIQKTFSFYKECVEKFGGQLGYDVWTSINNVFDVMPIAARIDQRIFCCHGGIPEPSMCPNLLDINNIPVHLPLPFEQSQLAWNLMWNDPVRLSDISDLSKSELASRNGFAFNSRRGTGLCFTSDAFNAFLGKHELSHMIRAHEYQVAGVSVQFNGRLLTVFSTSDYCGGRNDSACILLAQKKISVIRLASRGSL